MAIGTGTIGRFTGQPLFRRGREPQAAQPFGAGPSKLHKFSSVEQVVRPFVDVLSPPSQVREPKAPDLVHPEAYIEWGAAAEFATDTFRSDAQNVGFHVEGGEEPERIRYVFSEEGRRTTDYVVFGQDDPDSYVVLRVVDQIAFNGPSGEQFRLVLTPHQPGDRGQSGQTPPAPPTLADMD